RSNQLNYVPAMSRDILDANTSHSLSQNSLCYRGSMQIRSVACLACTLAAFAFGADPKATPEQARKFAGDAEQRLLILGVDAGRADWVKSTYITDDTEALSAKLDERAIAATVDYAK